MVAWWEDANVNLTLNGYSQLEKSEMVGRSALRSPAWDHIAAQALNTVPTNDFLGSCLTGFAVGWLTPGVQGRWETCCPSDQQRKT